VNPLHLPTWIWSLGGALLAWLAIGAVTQRFTLDTLAINATTASFLVIVALGQLLVVTGGEGGIDLSIPYVITLSAYWSSGIMNGSDAQLVGGIGVALIVGVLVGSVNAVLIVLLRIPPIVATLAVGFLADSAVNVYASNSRLGAPSPALSGFVRGHTLGLPNIVLVAIVLAACIAFVLRRVVIGRQLLATGQSTEAAVLSGVPVGTVRAATYVASGMLAGVAGLALTGYNNSAFLNMGASYLLASIGAVVLGGSLISGGRSTAIGTAAGALFLTLVLTLMQSSKLDVGLQNVGEGLLIIGVLLIAGPGSVQRRSRRSSGRRLTGSDNPRHRPSAAVPRR
jgi:ribose transport system permease protein